MPLVTIGDLERDGTTLYLHRDGGRKPVTLVYRRSDEDRVRDETGSLTGVAELLLEPWLSGEMGLVNAFGPGVGDDKRLHGHVEDFVRFYLGEEPLVASVPCLPHDTDAERAGRTRAPRRARGQAAARPRGGGGGDRRARAASRPPAPRSRARRHPEEFVVQPIIPLSCHPTVIGDHLEPRHVDLRVFAFCAEQVGLMPGGLTRVALDPGALVVNSSQNGGGKDTWVIDEA